MIEEEKEDSPLFSVKSAVRSKAKDTFSRGSISPEENSPINERSIVKAVQETVALLIAPIDAWMPK